MARLNAARGRGGRFASGVSDSRTTLPPPDANYVVYLGNYRTFSVCPRGRELVYAMPPPPLEKGQSPEDPEYKRLAGAAGRTILERTGQFMHEGGTAYVWGEQGDPTKLTEDGFPWVDCTLAPHFAWFERQNLEAIRQNLEPQFRCVMTPEMKREVLGMLTRKSREEREIEELTQRILA